MKEAKNSEGAPFREMIFMKIHYLIRGDIYTENPDLYYGHIDIQIYIYASLYIQSDIYLCKMYWKEIIPSLNKVINKENEMRVNEESVGLLPYLGRVYPLQGIAYCHLFGSYGQKMKNCHYGYIHKKCGVCSN